METARIAISANTGHLVVSTLHTLDAKETITGIIGPWGVVSQRLVNTTDGKRIPAVEVMKWTKIVSELIVENRDNEILDSIASGKEIYGSQSFDQSLFELYSGGKINKSTMFRYATNKSNMSLRTKKKAKIYFLNTF